MSLGRPILFLFPVACILCQPTLVCAQQQDTKHPLPAPDTQKKAESIIREIFREDYANATTPSANLSLAKKLFRQAFDNGNDPVARFVLLREARSLAVAGADSQFAVQVVDEIARHYEIDSLGVIVATLDSIGSTARLMQQRKLLAETAATLIDVAEKVDNYEAAKKLIEIAIEAARSVRDREMVIAMVARLNQIDEIAVEYREVQAAMVTLDQNPADPNANLTVGSFLCFRKEVWDRGLPMLALCNNRQLQQAAEMEIVGPKTAKAQVQVADAWWTLADEARGQIEDHVRAHAAVWYRVALTELSGLEKLRVQKRIDDVGSALADKPSTVSSSSRPPKPAVVASSRFDAARTTLLATLTEHTGTVYSIAFSPNGSVLASGSQDGTVKLWNLANGTVMATLREHIGEVFCVEFFPDGKTLASGGSDKAIKLWDLGTMQVRATLTGHASEIRSLAASPDGKMLASASRTLKVWDVSTGKEAMTLQGHAAFVHAVAWSPDGSLLASGSADKTVKLWDARTGQLLATLAGHTEQVRSVGFSLDGTKLASASLDKTLRIWDVESHRELITLSGHTHWVVAVAFSRDGKTLASSSVDNSIKLWEVDSGRELRTLTGHTSRPQCLAFAPQGTILASGAYDKTIRIWGPH